MNSQFNLLSAIHPLHQTGLGSIFPSKKFPPAIDYINTSIADSFKLTSKSTKTEPPLNASSSNVHSSGSTPCPSAAVDEGTGSVVDDEITKDRLYIEDKDT